MNYYWMGIFAGQKTASRTEPADRRRRILSAIGGMTLALLIGAGLFIAAALNS
jgi:hypothetical protein